MGEKRLTQVFFFAARTNASNSRLLCSVSPKAPIADRFGVRSDHLTAANSHCRIPRHRKRRAAHQLLWQHGPDSGERCHRRIFTRRHILCSLVLELAPPSATNPPLHSGWKAAARALLLFFCGVQLQETFIVAHHCHHRKQQRHPQRVLISYNCRDARQSRRATSGAPNMYTEVL